jgi:hypothetical protein
MKQLTGDSTPWSAAIRIDPDPPGAVDSSDSHRLRNVSHSTVYGFTPRAARQGHLYEYFTIRMNILP